MAEAKHPGEGSRKAILDPREFARVYGEWKEAIAKGIEPTAPWAIVGIKRGGALLARRLHQAFSSSPIAVKPELGEVDISLYRDDYHLQGTKAKVLGTEIRFPVEGRKILLVDDVLFTGRTVRAAIEQILDFGRPKKVLLAVLIDRGHRELPIAPDFTGKRLPTEESDRVEVSFQEEDGEDRVDLLAAPKPATGKQGGN